jgi:site-specific recombinase
MFLIRKKNKIDFIETSVRRVSVLPISEKKQGLDFIVSFFSAIRPSGTKGKTKAKQNLEAIIDELQKHPVFLTNLQHALLSQLVNTDLSSVLTESGIPLARGFWQEFFRRLRHKILPSLQSENNFLYVINCVFFRKKDYQWVEGIPHETWAKFFECIGISFHLDDKRIFHQLQQSLIMLAFQVAQLGLEKEVLDYIHPAEKSDNPFIRQCYLIHDLEEMLEEGKDLTSIRSIVSKIEKVLSQCYLSLEFVRENHSQKGASLHQTYTLLLLGNKLDRMSLLIDTLDQDQHFNSGKFTAFFKMLVRNENRKNSIREFLSQCLGYLAYQIAEHKGSKGNKYITSSAGDYRNMVLGAMSGGGIICFVAVIKNLLTALPMAIFWHSFSYSVNYSLGFIIIEESHSTLATKQPAFTASAVASSLDTRKIAQEPNLYNLALTVAKVSRSQIASFFGNLVVVFPGTFLLAWLYHLLTNTKILEGPGAIAMLADQHPWHSLSLLYACNAGFFLFLSGIIAGYVQNKIQYSHIAERLETHPLLRFSIPTQRLHRLATYLEKHAGPLIGNIALGFMLGMSGLVVKIFGIPFDVRHITLAAGNVAIAVYGIGINNIPAGYLATIICGVLGIGFFNFLISFSLAFIVAVKSRGVRLKEYPEFLGILWRYFCRKPLDFIRPRKQLVETE